MKLATCSLCVTLVAATALAAGPAGPRGGQAPPEDEIALPGEWFVTGTTADVLAGAEAVVRALGARLDRRDQARGVIITRDATYGPAWPAIDALALPATQTPRSAAIHVHVAPGWVPARLAVGAILQTSTTTTPLAPRRARGESILYGQRALARAIAERIAQHLQATLVPIPADAETRSREAARLGDRRAEACGTAPMVPDDTREQLPTLVSQVLPTYPRQELHRGRGGAIQVRGEVTEHGTLTSLRWVQGVEDANLMAATFGAAGLWRFTAPAVAECRARRRITIEMSYTIRS